jgi:signal peptidase I
VKVIIDTEKIRASEGKTTIPQRLRELMRSAAYKVEGAVDPASSIMFNYYGSSMNPAFKAGDCLTVLPYGTKMARPGDVIVFRPPPGSGHNIVHRIVRVDFQGVATRGYNCSHNDPWILKPENIIGRVISAKRAGRNFKIRAGRAGIVVAGILRARKWIGSRISKTLHPLYHRLAQSGVLHGRLSCSRKMKLLYFKKLHGTEIQLIVGKWIIGRYIPRDNSWQIKRPFRLFIDTSVLPNGKAINAHKI